MHDLKIYFASSNEHKKQEMMRLLDGVVLTLPKEESMSFDPVEDGNSFIEKALIKGGEGLRVAPDGLLCRFVKECNCIYRIIQLPHNSPKNNIFLQMPIHSCLLVSINHLLHLPAPMSLLFYMHLLLLSKTFYVSPTD